MPKIQKTSKVSDTADNLKISTVKNFSSLSDMQQEFVIFTDALMYTHGKLRRDMLAEFTHASGLKKEDRPIAINFDHKIFDIEAKPDFERPLNSSLFAIKHRYWNDLETRFVGLTPFSFETGFYANFNCHDLVIPDYCYIRDRNSVSLQDVPKVVIRSFAVFSREGNYFFSSPVLERNLMCQIQSSAPSSAVRADSMAWLTQNKK